MPDDIRINGMLVMTGFMAVALMPAPIADAANPEPVTVGMSFIDPVSVTVTNSLQFGFLDVNMGSGETVIISPDDSVTDSFGNVVGGTQAAAKLTVTASPSLPITILVDNVTSGTGYALSSILCNYNGAGSDTACTGSGYSETSATTATLRIGATLTANASISAGPDNSSFDVTVNYQ